MNIDYVCGGALRSDCPWYIPRWEDALIFNGLARGESCYVRTLHQMGKSSLLVRLAEKFRNSGLSTVVTVDLSALGCGLNAVQWYNGLALRIGRQLRLEDEFDDFWEAYPQLPPCARFLAVLEQVALRGRPGSLIILVDEADLVRSLPFSPDDLLRAIQTAADRRGVDGTGFNRMVFCLFGTAAPAELWRHAEQQPRHLGTVVALRDFAYDELLSTAGRWAAHLLSLVSLPHESWGAPARGAVTEVLDRVFYWTNGHPYLTQKLGCASAACVGRQLARGTHVTAPFCHRMVDHFNELLFIAARAREQDCHLLWIQHQFASCNGDPDQISRLLRSLHGRRVSAASVDPRLVGSGLLRLTEGRVEWRNRIYERVLTDPCLGHGSNLGTTVRLSLPGRGKVRSTPDPPVEGGFSPGFEIVPVSAWRSEAEFSGVDAALR